MNMKNILIGVLVMGLLASAVKADWSTSPRYTIQAYAERAVSTIPVFTPDQIGNTFLSSGNIGLNLPNAGVWGVVEGRGSPYLLNTMWGNASLSFAPDSEMPYSQYLQDLNRIYAIGAVGANVQGSLAWVKPDYTIPYVYMFDGKTPATIDKDIIAAVKAIPPPFVIGFWDGEVRHDICVGTTNTDFCTQDVRKEMKRYGGGQINNQPMPDSADTIVATSSMSSATSDTTVTYAVGGGASPFEQTVQTVADNSTTTADNSSMVSNDSAPAGNYSS